MNNQAYTTNFIPIPSYSLLIDNLDRAVTQKGICTLFGPFGCGKSALIDYWVRVRKRPKEMLQPQQSLYIHLRPAPDTKFPMLCMVYARLWHRLQQLDQPAYLTVPEDRNASSGLDIKVYNSRQLQSLLLKLIDRANRRNIRAVIVDNAHFLDKLALEWLLDLRMYYDEQEGFVPRRAIILVGRSDLPEGERMLKNLESIDEALPAWRGLRLEMKHLSRAEFLPVFGQLLAKNFQVEFHPELSELEQTRKAVGLWRCAGGTTEKTDTGEISELSGARWRAIEALAADLDEALGPWDGIRPRVLTREILEQINARWMPAATNP